MKTVLIALAIIFMHVAVAIASIRPKPRQITLEVMYKGKVSPDTFKLFNPRAPLCITEYNNGETCLVAGKDSIIACNVRDYKVLKME